MVAKRYRSPEHTSCHRSGSYTEGRRTKDTREARAMAKGTAFGRQVAAAQWARSEFDVLGRMWSAGLPVPYPVQILGTEVCMEFVGTDDDHDRDSTRQNYRHVGRSYAASCSEKNTYEIRASGHIVLS